eukprot:153829_1
MIIRISLCRQLTNSNSYTVPEKNLFWSQKNPTSQSSLKQGIYMFDKWKSAKSYYIIINYIYKIWLDVFSLIKPRTQHVYAILWETPPKGELLWGKFDGY